MDKALKEKEAICLGPVEKVALGHGSCFKVGSDEIAVFRPRSGGVVAIENRCPHRQGALCDGIIDGQKVVCPYHAHL